MRTRYILTASLFFLALAVPAHALTIDFEDASAAANFSNQDLVSRGYLFDFVFDHGHLLNDSHFGLPSNGSNWLGVDDRFGNEMLTVTPLGGGAFDLLALDLAEFFDEPSSQVLLTGRRVAGGTLSELLFLDAVRDGVGGLDDFQTFTFGSQWAGLRALVFDSQAGTLGPHQGWALDNLQVAPSRVVPEPTSLALFGTALCALLVRCRSSQRR